MRDKLIHGYFVVDHHVIEEELPLLKPKIEKILGDVFYNILWPVLMFKVLICLCSLRSFPPVVSIQLPK